MEIISPLTFGFEPTMLNGLIGALLSLFVMLSMFSRSIKLAPEMRLPLAVMIFLALMIPTWLSGRRLADIRLPVTLPFVVLASTRFQPSPTVA
jgi:hypothetical protein